MTPVKTIYVISDGTGETALTMVRAATVQYASHSVTITRCKNMRTEQQIESLFDDMVASTALVVHTVVGHSIRDKILSQAQSRQVLCVDLLGPLLTQLDLFLGQAHNQTEPGKLRMVNESYFRKIAAIEYTVQHDDGKFLKDLNLADIVLVGISRTSKTPLSIFLSHKGFKVANVPLVLNQPVPPELLAVDQKKIVALTLDFESLMRIRRNRLERFGQDSGGLYASPNYIQSEIEYALELFKKNRRWPVFNVTDRALEETAAEITKVIGSRFNWPSDEYL